jgi:hypothetical protein
MDDPHDNLLHKLFSQTLFSKMSFMDATLVIENASMEHNAIFVKTTFDTIFGAGFIEQVREIVISPVGWPQYKKFYIYTLDDEHPAMKRITDLINYYKFAAIVYKHELEPATMEYVRSHWKVTFAPIWKTFTPYLMNEAQMDEIVPIEPWSAEAEVAFGPVKTYTEVDTDEEETLVLPPPMVRDNGGPYKLVRSTNIPPQAQAKEEVNDEDYWKILTPPRLVRQTNFPLVVDCEAVELVETHRKTYE